MSAGSLGEGKAEAACPMEKPSIHPATQPALPLFQLVRGISVAAVITEGTMALPAAGHQTQGSLNGVYTAGPHSHRTQQTLEPVPLDPCHYCLPHTHCFLGPTMQAGRKGASTLDGMAGSNKPQKQKRGAG